MSGNLYIIRTREFISLNENIYKIGRTQRTIEARLYGYPKGSKLEYYVNVDTDVVIAEAILIKLLKKNPNLKHCRDYGNEYFEGELENIKNDMDRTLHHVNSTIIEYSCPLCKIFTTNNKKELLKHIQDPFDCKKTITYREIPNEEIDLVNESKDEIINSLLNKINNLKEKILYLTEKKIKTRTKMVQTLKINTNSIGKKENVSIGTSTDDFQEPPREKQETDHGFTEDSSFVPTIVPVEPVVPVESVSPVVRTIVKFTCQRCHRNFTTKQDVIRHLGKKSICKTTFSTKLREQCIEELKNMPRKVRSSIKKNNNIT